MTRILYVQRPAGGGSATGLLDLVRSLRGRDIDPVVLFHRASPFREEFEDAGAETLSLRAERDDVQRGDEQRGGSDFASRLYRLGAPGALLRLAAREIPTAWRIARVIESVGPDLVHHNNNPAANRASIIAALVAGVPQVAHVRMLRDYMRRLDPLLARSVNRFVYMSEAIRQDAGGQLKTDAGRGEVVYDPFDLSEWAPEDDGRRRVRREEGIGPKETVITNVGRLTPWKGQDVFLRALGRLGPDAMPYRALLVGSAEGDRGERFARRLRGLTEELGLGDRVRFLGFRRDIPALLQASDIVVHSSTTPEPFGRVVVEAMASGRPVVATAAGGPLEIVDEGVTGLLVEPGDPEAMAEAIGWLARDSSRAREMGARGRRVARERFAPSRFADQMTTLYRQVLSR